MARLARLYVPGIPQLVQASFARPLAAAGDPAPAATLDKLASWLGDAVRQQGLPVHGWVLLYDRLALLASPPAAPGMARLIQAFGRSYATRLQHGRVFTARYRSALVQPQAWVVPALIWLDCLPVRLGYVERPEAWPWSSASRHAGGAGKQHDFTSDHPDYWNEGNTPFERQARYRQHLAKGLSDTQSARIESALFGQWGLGEAEFLERVGAQASRRLTPASRGRPRKRPAAGSSPA